MTPLAAEGAAHAHRLVGGGIPAAQGVGVQQEEAAVLAGLHEEAGVHARGERQADRPAGAEVGVGLVQLRGISRAEEVIRRQDAVGVDAEPDHRVAELARHRAARPGRRRDAVAGGQEDPARAVGHQATAGVPDAGLVLRRSGLGRPQGLRVIGGVHAGDEAEVVPVVAVGGVGGVHPAVQQQQAGALPFQRRVELLVRRVGGRSADGLAPLDRAGLLAERVHVDGRRLGALVPAGGDRDHVHRLRGRVVDGGAGDSEQRVQVIAAGRAGQPWRAHGLLPLDRAGRRVQAVDRVVLGGHDHVAGRPARPARLVHDQRLGVHLPVHLLGEQLAELAAAHRRRRQAGLAGIPPVAQQVLRDGGHVLRVHPCRRELDGGHGTGEHQRHGSKACCDPHALPKATTPIAVQIRTLTGVLNEPCPIRYRISYEFLMRIRPPRWPRSVRRAGRWSCRCCR